MLNIPIIPIQKQKDIVAHITELRNKAASLQNEGKTILSTAKQQIENSIINSR